MKEPKTKRLQKPENSDRTSSIGIFVLFGVLVIFYGMTHGHELAEGLHRLEDTVAEMDYWGPILVTAIASVWAVLCLPGPIILGFIGTVFSHRPHIGLLIATVADSVAEAVGFLVARHMGRDYVLRWLGKKPWFEWLEKQIKERGVYGVFVVRMMPFFPNSLANYAFGLSALRFWPYFLASVLGSIPNLALYIGGTAGVVHLVREGISVHFNMYIAAGTLVATTIMLLGLQAILRRQSRLAEDQAEEM